MIISLMKKKNMLEIIDKKFFSFLKDFVKDKDIKVVVTCDHSTPCRLKMHSPHPVPVLVYNSKDKDRSAHFTEAEAKKGSLGKMFGKDFIVRTGLNR